MQLLAITGDERDGIALIEQLDDVFDILLLLAKLRSQKPDHFFHVVLLYDCFFYYITGSGELQNILALPCAARYTGEERT